MRTNIIKYSVLAALLGFVTVQGAKIKQGDGFLSENRLAQTGAKCDIESELEFGSENDAFGDFHHGIFKANSAEAVAGVATEEDMYHDHKCYERHD